MSYYIYTPPNAGRLHYMWYPGYVAQPANVPVEPATPVPKPAAAPPMAPAQYLASMPYVPSPYTYPAYPYYVINPFRCSYFLVICIAQKLTYLHSQSTAPVPTVYQPYPTVAGYPQYYYPVPPVIAAPAPTAATTAAPKKEPPAPPIFWYGNTTAEVNAQNAAIAATKGVVPGASAASASTAAAAAAPSGKPSQLVPFKQEDEPQYWCRELEGDWTLRTVEEIDRECKLGFWTYTNEGHPFYTRMAPKPAGKND